MTGGTPRQRDGALARHVASYTTPTCAPRVLSTMRTTRNFHDAKHTPSTTNSMHTTSSRHHMYHVHLAQKTPHRKHTIRHKPCTPYALYTTLLTAPHTILTRHLLALYPHAHTIYTTRTPGRPCTLHTAAHSHPHCLLRAPNTPIHSILSRDLLTLYPHAHYTLPRTPRIAMHYVRRGAHPPCIMHTPATPLSVYLSYTTDCTHHQHKPLHHSKPHTAATKALPIMVKQVVLP